MQTADGTPINYSINNGLDLTGIGLSVGCALHCLALPVAVAFTPSLAVLAEAEWVHWAAVALAIPVAVLSLRTKGTPQQSQVLAALGLAVMIVGALEFPSHEAAAWVTAIGGALLATGHVLSIRANHKRSAPYVPCDGDMVDGERSPALDRG